MQIRDGNGQLPFNLRAMTNWPLTYSKEARYSLCWESSPLCHAAHLHVLALISGTVDTFSHSSSQCTVSGQCKSAGFCALKALLFFILVLCHLIDCINLILEWLIRQTRAHCVTYYHSFIYFLSSLWQTAKYVRLLIYSISRFVTRDLDQKWNNFCFG